MIGIKIS